MALPSKSINDMRLDMYDIYPTGSMIGKRYGIEIAKNIISNAGYYVVKIKYKNGKKKNTHVHRIIAGVFIPNPENKEVVNHINGNKLDNRIENLEWVSTQENRVHYTATTLNFITRAREKLHSDSDLIELERINGRSRLTYTCRVCMVQHTARLDSTSIERGLCFKCAKKKKGKGIAKY